ncbi:GDSL-like Lipase/Acylhydrolase superfamily protein [Actinidia rufa]|uniref:GDSL-like Lipase/Acylhydrolase superfamily protein n=1 Tax=Actinidia rufa TaxID=165716 RepID=A0A7J0ER85_9ERIC|nr:GDSL-like Lipase/Acylhydrolase superfamily protein [Actinidia rufa]
MANPQVILSLVVILINSSWLFLLPHLCHGHDQLEKCNFDKIYQLGDSYSDTGNLIRESPVGSSTPFTRLPYGETFFKNATGRCSDGLLMIDYLAIALGLPLLNPYKMTDADFRHGVNFAVAGSTALPVEFLTKKNISSPATNSSLSVQLDWMLTHFDSLCHEKRDCTKKLENSLFVVGEIGGNDYNYPLIEGKGIELAKSIMPNVIEAIKDAVRRVIDYGAVRVIVPGDFPIGCYPMFLTIFPTNDSTAYDQNRCLRQLNNLAMDHNNRLQEAIEELKKEFPDTVIVCTVITTTRTNGFSRTLPILDSMKWLYEKLVVESEVTTISILGGSAEHRRFRCVSDPNQYISFDGIHSTQHAYMLMSGWLIQDILPKLQCTV